MLIYIRDMFKIEGEKKRYKDLREGKKKTKRLKKEEKEKEKLRKREEKQENKLKLLNKKINKEQKDIYLIQKGKYNSMKPEIRKDVEYINSKVVEFNKLKEKVENNHTLIKEERDKIKTNVGIKNNLKKEIKDLESNIDHLKYVIKLHKENQPATTSGIKKSKKLTKKRNRKQLKKKSKKN